MGFQKTSGANMDLIVYPLLCPESKKAMIRSKRKYGPKWGHPYYYEPNGRLLNRLAVKLRMTPTEVRERIMKEREYLLSRAKIES